jgi:hypothetical protein
MYAAEFGTPYTDGLIVRDDDVIIPEGYGEDASDDREDISFEKRFPDVDLSAFAIGETDAFEAVFDRKWYIDGGVVTADEYIDLLYVGVFFEQVVEVFCSA